MQAHRHIDVGNEHTLLRRIHTDWEIVGIILHPLRRDVVPAHLRRRGFVAEGDVGNRWRVGSALKGAA